MRARHSCQCNKMYSITKKWWISYQIYTTHRAYSSKIVCYAHTHTSHTHTNLCGTVRLGSLSRSIIFYYPQRYCHDVDGVGIQFKPFIFIQFSISLSMRCLQRSSKSYSNQCNIEIIFDRTREEKPQQQQTRKSSHAVLIKVNSMNRNRKIMKEFTIARVWTKPERRRRFSIYSIIGQINFSSRATAHKSQWRMTFDRGNLRKQVTQFATHQPHWWNTALRLAFRSRYVHFCFSFSSLFFFCRWKMKSGKTAQRNSNECKTI